LPLLHATQQVHFPGVELAEPLQAGKVSFGNLMPAFATSLAAA
jgi:hypothetical protein